MTLVSHSLFNTSLSIFFFKNFNDHFFRVLERTLKPVPATKGLNFAVNQYPAHLTLAPEVYNHLRGLQKKAKELRTEVRTLRRLAQTQAMAVREDIKDSFIRIRATLLAGGGNLWGQGDQERVSDKFSAIFFKKMVSN